MAILTRNTKMALFMAATLAILTAAISGFAVERMSEPLICRQDAKLCPDGSSVERVGPNCEFADCAAGPGTATGTITGTVDIGPICPIEPCPVSVANPYLSRKIILQRREDSKGAADVPIYIALNSDGTFREDVPADIYTLTLSDCNFQACRFALPKTVEVQSGQMATVDIHIDTGVR